MPGKVKFNYEAMVILNPSLSEEDTGALVDKLGGVLTEGGAQMREIARWGKRRLAYAIGKKNEGYYVIFYFTLPEERTVLSNFERVCRYDENVFRFMVVKVPIVKHGQPVAQLVPQPGYLAEWRFEPRGFGRRGGYRDHGPRSAPPAAPSVVEAESAAEGSDASGAGVPEQTEGEDKA